MDLVSVLRRLYDSEIDVSISSRWDVGWQLEIEGGQVARTFVESLDEAAAWFHEQVLARLPESTYARSYLGGYREAVRDDVRLRRLGGA